MGHSDSRLWLVPGLGPIEAYALLNKICAGVQDMKNLGELKFPETRWEVDSAAVHQDINQQIGSNFAGSVS